MSCSLSTCTSRDMDINPVSEGEIHTLLVHVHDINPVVLPLHVLRERLALMSCCTSNIIVQTWH